MKADAAVTRASWSSWLPPDKSAAVCLSVDDVHPTAPVDRDGLAVGDTARSALAHLEWLLDRHPRLRATLFTTPDWRSRSAYPTTRWLRRVPLVRRVCYAADVLPRGTLRLDRHPAFVRYLRGLRGVDFAIHGLHHVRRGPAHIAEFAGRSRRQCRRMIDEARGIMAAAGLPIVAGLAPPAWVAPPALLEVMAERHMLFIASARDLDTPIAPDAVTHGSGLRGVSLVYPQPLAFERLVHITTNFQATSAIGRALAILDCGGLLSIKAHLLKRFGAYIALDGLDRPYVEYLDRLLTRIEDRDGDRIWWTTMTAVARRMRDGFTQAEVAS